MPATISCKLNRGRVPAVFCEIDKTLVVGHSPRMPKSALGRGLSALLGEESASPAATASGGQSAAPASVAHGGDGRERVERVGLGRILPCPFQPRKNFPEEALRELADSIREQGIVQPLIVRRKGDSFELIAGERRLRAAQLCGLTEVPVLVREADDATALEMALIENLQRENLNPIEEAEGYQQLIDQFQLRQEDVAVKVGKSRVAVANALRFLKLPAEVQAFLRNGQLSPGHAKVILSLTQPEGQKLAAERVIKRGLNVRETEKLVAYLQGGRGERARGKGEPAAARDAQVAALEDRLQERFGTRVHLRYKAGKGSVEIQFFSDDDLERILELAGVRVD